MDNDNSKRSIRIKSVENKTANNFIINNNEQILLEGNPLSPLPLPSPPTKNFNNGKLLFRRNSPAQSN